MGNKLRKQRKGTKYIELQDGKEAIDILYRAFAYHYQKTEFNLDLSSTDESEIPRAKDRIIEDAINFFSFKEIWLYNLGNEENDHDRNFTEDRLHSVYSLIDKYSAKTVEANISAHGIPNIDKKEKERAHEILIGKEIKIVKSQVHGNKPIKALTILTIAGTRHINEEYIKEINDSNNFSPAEFYTAKNRKDCQWYGIIKKYDIRKDLIDDIIESIHRNFETSYYKVLALVHGTGGIGKSTIMRRLALELRSETFHTLWVTEEENGFDSFISHGLQQIKENKEQNFLVLIDDWQRITQNLKDEAKIFITDIQHIKNIRLVISDRTVDQKPYTELCNTENIFKIDSGQNENIINQIIADNKELKKIAKQIFSKKENYNTSLFLLLFILFRSLENSKNSINKNNLSDPQIAFRNIANADILKIQELNDGLAKVIFYWSCMYTEFRISIYYDYFLKLADYFNDNNDSSSQLHNLEEGQSFLHDKMRLYFHIETKRYNNSSVQHENIQINHDLLAELGISQIAPLINYNFDDLAKRKILEFATDNIINSHQSAKMVAHFFNYYMPIFKKDEGLEIAIKVLRKGKYKNSIIQFLKNSRDKSKNQVLYQEILTHEYILDLSPDIIISALNNSTNYNEINNLCDNILKIENIGSLGDQIIFSALEKSKNATTVQKACEEILNVEHLNKRDVGMVGKALNKSKNETKVQNVCDEILKVEHLNKWKVGLVDKALDKSKNETKVQNICGEILKIEHLNKWGVGIVIKALNKSKNKTKVQKACDEILKIEHLNKWEIGMVIKALNKSKNETKVQKACDEILKIENITILPKEIISTALNKSKNETTLQKVCDEILKIENINVLAEEITSVALNKSKNETVLQKSCDTILKNVTKGKFSYQSINVALSKSKNETLVQKICDKILKNEGDDKLNKFSINTAFIKSENNKLKSKHATRTLEQFEQNKKVGNSMIYHSLRFFSETTPCPNIAIDTVNRVIDNYINDPNTSLFVKKVYIDILKLPFHSITTWKKTTLYIINNWQKMYYRTNLTNVLLAYRSQSDKIKDVCQSILKAWKTEINQEILLTGRKKKYYGNHVKIALGHPEINPLARKVAQEILDENKNGKINIPEYIIPFTQEIVDSTDDNFPSWPQSDNSE